MNKKIVVFGGGTGLNWLLKGLKQFPVDITAVVGVADNGRSTGKLRQEFNMPAVGDIRNVITSLADTSDDIKKLLSYRFNTSSDLNGHPIGNLILVGMYNITGSLKSSIEVLSDFLNVNSKVLPLSEDNLTLIGETVDGKQVIGEEQITTTPCKFKKFYYQNEPHILQEVKDAVMEADLIIFSMGSLITSILPHLLSSELRDTIDKCHCKIMYTCNAVAQPGETDEFKVSDHIVFLNDYLGKRKIDVVVVANTKLDKEIVLKYENEEQKDLVEIDRERINEMGVSLIEGDILMIKDNLIRHDSLKLSTLIFDYLMR